MLTLPTSRRASRSFSGRSRCVIASFSRCPGVLLIRAQFDDLSDEGALQSKPDAVQVGVDISMEVLKNPAAPAPNFPYAAMLHEYV